MLDITNALLGGVTLAGGVSQSLQANYAPLAVGRLEEERLNRTRGPALNALVEDMIPKNDDFPFSATPAEMAAYKRRVRRLAYASSTAQEHDEQRQSTAIGGYRNRQTATDASAFACLPRAKTRRVRTCWH